MLTFSLTCFSLFGHFGWGAEELEHIGARVDNDFDSLDHAGSKLSDDVFMHFANAGEKCSEVRSLFARFPLTFP